MFLKEKLLLFIKNFENIYIFWFILSSAFDFLKIKIVIFIMTWLFYNVFNCLYFYRCLDVVMTSMELCAWWSVLAGGRRLCRFSAVKTLIIAAFGWQWVAAVGVWWLFDTFYFSFYYIFKLYFILLLITNFLLKNFKCLFLFEVWYWKNFQFVF